MTNLADQPVAYWTGVAYEAIIAFIREQQAAHGYTQPQFWLLRNLSPHDISPDGHGMTLAELEAAMTTYLRREDDLAEAAEPLVERGWLRRDEDDRLWITDAGEEALAELKTLTPAIRDAIHEGIDDADYATTVAVLQRMIRNVGGPAML
ncbi:MarR family winged helix-turn-helix transcriptional regulator [Paractinoplanes lichenicola]|uniref:MarR family transcriptional regulator n=1 Tax=Paractinoplanes lichenicola TaxID=2802976 RepID=A0ABS1VWW2_9ACTN|nr:MarR family transcriptional regulator [Actinoplanes lichenicola]MBL7258981.1 MarR family transcriptional regulator [Actinoplanes lichenicola]